MPHMKHRSPSIAPAYTGRLSTNPIPIKTAMALAGHCDGELRLPMSPMSDAGTAELKGILTKLGIV